MICVRSGDYLQLFSGKCHSLALPNHRRFLSSGTDYGSLPASGGDSSLASQIPGMSGDHPSIQAYPLSENPPNHQLLSNFEDPASSFWYPKRCSLENSPDLLRTRSRLSLVGHVPRKLIHFLVVPD